MARVLVLTLVFPPDGVSTAVIMGELAADLKRDGHDVTVVTTVPHYNKDAEAEGRQPLHRKWAGLLARSEFEGVPVVHVAMPQKNANRLLRVLAWIQFHVLSVVATLVLVRRVDVIVSPSPPLTIGVCAWLLGLAYRAPYVYIVQELYPDIAIKLGAIRSRWVIRLLLALERFVYARARVITVIAGRMRGRIIDKGMAAAKVRLIPNFVDVDGMAPQAGGGEDNAFSHTHGLGGRLVVTYAGNMGPAQGLETVLRAAALLRDEPRVLFLFVGEGGERARLMAMASEEELTNVRFLPHQPYAVVPQIYGASGLCLVPLTARTGSDAVPSKVYRIMACARPVLVAAEPDCDLAVLVRTAQCGVVVPPGSPDDLARAVREAAHHPERCASMGEAGRAHVLAHYSRRAITGQYQALIREVTAGPNPVPEVRKP